MRTHPLISIVMPVKNAGLFLKSCIESILNQTYTHWELIAVNDSSSDNSLEILQNFASSDNRITVKTNTGTGIIAAMRLALKNAKGEMITRMDADDKMSPEKIELLSSQLLSVGYGNIVVGLVKYFSDSELGDGYLKYEKWLNALTKTTTNYDEIYKECVIPSPNWMLYKKDLLACGAFENDTYPEDYDLCFRMRSAELNVCAVNEVTHFWRDHPDRFSRHDPNYADNRFLDLKCQYFIKDDYDTDKSLILWGAGRKGKVLAQLLQKENISFDWISNNPKKIGLDIYGIEIKSEDTLTKIQDPQVIIVIAAIDAQTGIRNKLKELKILNYYYFC